MSKILVAAVVVLGGLVGVTEAGAVKGPLVHVDVVKARETDVYRVAFFGGATAKIVVVGDRDTDLDLYVYNADGVLVAKAEGPTDAEVVEFVAAGGVYIIKVVNRGKVSNKYAIGHN